MKRILFNDKFGLTQAVLEGRKTMTRRIAYMGDIQKPRAGFLTEGSVAGTLVLTDNWKIVAKSRYKVGEVVAIAQRYSEMNRSTFPVLVSEKGVFKKTENCAGWNNKMYVEAYLMPHQILIKNVRVERLQDISNEDCLREGVVKVNGLYGCEGVCERGDQLFFCNPREAFSALIKKIAGNKAWDDNPYVFVYEFELVK